MSAMLRVDGAVVFWSLGSNSDLDTIRLGWEAIDPSWASYAPAVRTKQSMLHDALAHVFNKDLIRPLEKRDGFAILKETRLKDEVTTECFYSVTVDENTDVIDFRKGWDYSLLTRIREEYRAQARLVKPAQVAAALVKVIERLGGVRLRPTGGFYWLADSALPLWSRLIDVVSRAGKNSVYQITHDFNADSIRAVRDAVLAEADRVANEILDEVEKGDLGERALRTKAEQAEALQAKVKEYERILGECLPAAGAIAHKAEMTAISARLSAQVAVAV